MARSSRRRAAGDSVLPNPYDASGKARSHEWVHEDRRGCPRCTFCAMKETVKECETRRRFLYVPRILQSHVLRSWCSTSFTYNLPLQSRAPSAATSKLDQSMSDQLPDQTVFASLLDRPSPLLRAWAIHTRQEHGQRALFRPNSPPPCAYGLRAFLDIGRYPRSSQLLRADHRLESSCTFCGGGRTTPMLLHSLLR